MDFGLPIDPLSTDASLSATNAPSPGQGPGIARADQGPATLLVVDPDRGDRQAILELGQRLMVPLKGAATLKEGIGLAQRPMICGVLLATSAVPRGISLRGAIEALRGPAALPPLPIALMDRPGQLPDRVRALWAGASAVLAKPLTPSALGRTLRGLIAQSQAHRSTLLVTAPTPRFSAIMQAAVDLPTITLEGPHSHASILDSLRRWSPQLLVIHTDAVEGSPLTLCRTLRALPRWQDLPIVLVSAHDQAALRLAAYEVGADDVLTEGLAGPELRARLQVRLHRAKRLKERADYDLLTGLPTRRAFLEDLAARLSQADRHRRPLAFCLLDVDRFKQVNDRYGHLLGDRVLERLGHLLGRRFRIEDLRARWGGEEFAVVLVDEGVDTAQQALQRLLDEFSQIPFSDDGGSHFYVTFSAGIAQFPTDGQALESLVAAADDRLLQAKRAGRHRIFAHHHRGAPPQKNS